MIYYVSNNGNDYAEGTKEAPFRTINHAAQIAAAGDTVRFTTECTASGWTPKTVDIIA